MIHILLNLFKSLETKRQITITLSEKNKGECCALSDHENESNPQLKWQIVVSNGLCYDPEQSNRWKIFHFFKWF